MYSDSFNFSETAILESTQPGQRISQDLLFPEIPSQHLNIVPIVIFVSPLSETLVI